MSDVTLFEAGEFGKALATADTDFGNRPAKLNFPTGTDDTLLVNVITEKNYGASNTPQLISVNDLVTLNVLVRKIIGTGTTVTGDISWGKRFHSTFQG